MRKFLLWLALAAPVAIVLIAYAAANRHRVLLNLDPFSPLDQAVYTASPPVYFLVFCTLGIGLLIGGFSTWLGQHKWRKRARHETREAEKWKKETDRLTAQIEAEEQARLEEAPSDGRALTTTG